MVEWFSRLADIPDVRYDRSSRASWSQVANRNATTTRIRVLQEALERPGSPSNYHFAILGCIEELWTWQRRRGHPELLAEIEDLCWLDVRLVGAMPSILTYERNGEQLYSAVPAFHHLIELYEREGFLQDALAVARRAARFYPDYPRVLELEQRIAQLDAEMSD